MVYPDPLTRSRRLRPGAGGPGGLQYGVSCHGGRGRRPSCRMLLLKSAGRDGFVVYTNLESRKGREALRHPLGALCFYWASIYKQVRVEGRLERVSDDKADAYFANRPPGEPNRHGAGIEPE